MHFGSASFYHCQQSLAYFIYFDFIHFIHSIHRIMFVKPFLIKRMAFTKLFPSLLILITICLITIQLVHFNTNSDIVSSGSITKVNLDDDSADINAKINNAVHHKTQSQKKPQTSEPVDEDFNFKDYEFTITPEESYDHGSSVDDLIQKESSFKKFINEDILKLIKESGPSVPAINNKEHYNPDNKYKMTWDKRLPVSEGKLRENNIVDPIRSKNYLGSFLQLSDEEKKSLKDAHDEFLEKLPKEYPSDIKFSGNGILYAGGGNYNWLVLISLKMLRDTGSKLPVEVFIPTENEYSVDLCNHVFPILGAKCIVMSSFLDQKLNFKLKGYQLKSMALMLSSFENILLLDSDNIPVKNPDYLFVNEPYKSKGMIVWPDFWRRSTSPLYYEIVGINVDETKHVRNSYNDERDTPPNTETLEQIEENISYHDLKGTFAEASSESGQLLVNKKTHARAIFLSLYYNYYGPDYYYGLMAQGQAGEGDKETYLAAAHELGLSYYQVQEFIREYGFVRDDGGIDIAAMGQYDPVIDAIQSKNEEKYKTNFAYDSSKDNYRFHKYSRSETLFLHCNDPKVYPWRVAGKGLEHILNGDGGRRRIYSDILIAELGYDFELKLMNTLAWVLCEHGDLKIKGMKYPDLYCGKVRHQIKFLETGIDETLIKDEEEKENEEVKEKEVPEVEVQKKRGPSRKSRRRKQSVNKANV